MQIDEDVQVRPATVADADECGKVLFEGFKAIAARHGFPPDFASIAAATAAAGPLILNSRVHSLCAEWAGQIVGCMFVNERDPVRSMGPGAVLPGAQGRGIGARLFTMAHRYAEPACSLRGVADAYNVRLLAMYVRLGYRASESLVLMQGRLRSRPASAVTVRPMRPTDVDACSRLCEQVHGVARRNELVDCLRVPVCRPFVAEVDRQLTAYATAVDFWQLNHGVAVDEMHMRALLLGAAKAVQEVALLAPVRETAFLRWCLDEGLVPTVPKCLYTAGDYQQPAGFAFPSVQY